MVLRRLFGGFGRKPALVKGASRLPEGQAKKVTFGDPLAGAGAEIILCRVEGKLRALDVLCPHEGGRIAEGPLAEGKFAVCPLHMYYFEPSSGRVINASCKKAKTYKVREVGEDAEVFL